MSMLGYRTLVTLLAGTLTACGATEPEVPVASSVTVSETTVSFSSIGEERQLTAVVSDQNGNEIPGQTVQWGSSDALVASVSNGLVVAVGNGTAAISAVSGGAQASVAVDVSQVAALLELTPTSLSFESLGDTTSLSLLVEDALGHSIPVTSVTWSSSEPSVATVSSDGLITANGNGESVVYAASGPMTDSAIVSVQQLVVTLEVTPTTDTLRAWGDTARVVASAFDARGGVFDGAPISWASSDEGIIGVQGDGLWYAVGNGVASVIASATTSAGTVADSAEVVVLATHGVSRWIGDAGSAWSDPASWYLGRVPGALDDVSIERAGGSEVLFDLPTTTVRNLQVGLTSPDSQRVTIAGQLLNSDVSEVDPDFSFLGPTASVELAGGELGGGTGGDQLNSLGAFVWTGGALGHVLITSTSGRTVLRPGGGDLVLALGGGLTIDETDTAARWEGDGRLVFTDPSGGVSLQNFVVAGEMNAVWDGTGSAGGIPIQSGGASGVVSFDLGAAPGAQLVVTDLDISLDAFVRVIGGEGLPSGTVIDVVTLSGTSTFTGSPVSGTQGWQLQVNPETGVGLRAVKQ